MLQAVSSMFRAQMWPLNLIYLILLTTTWLRALLNLYPKWVPEDISGVKARPVSKADNITVICETII
jgi:hypothetical protein